MRPLAHAVPGVRRYVQNHIQDERTRPDIATTEVAVDGVAELWFDDRAAMDRANASPEAKRLHDDGALFIGGIKTFIIEEQVIIPISGVTAMRAGRPRSGRRAAMSPDTRIEIGEGHGQVHRGGAAEPPARASITSPALATSSKARRSRAPCRRGKTRRRRRRAGSTPSSCRAARSPRRERENRRSWLYRIRPSAMHKPFRQIDSGLLRTAPCDEATPSPNRLRWNPLPYPDAPADFIDGLATIGTNGDAGGAHRHRHSCVSRDPADDRPRLL